MGYVRVPRLYNLVFEEYHGLSVRARSVSTDTFLELLSLAGAKEDAEDAEAAKQIAIKMIDIFVVALHDWNLEECCQEAPDCDCRARGVVRAVPATEAGVRSQDIDFTLELITEWMTAIAGVSPPLAGTSSSGETSLEGSLPMEILSSSRAS